MWMCKQSWINSHHKSLELRIWTPADVSVLQTLESLQKIISFQQVIVYLA